MSKKLINNLIINAEQICNSKDTSVLIVDIREGIRYENGKPTGEIDHYKYDVVLPFNQYEKITVKIKGNALLTLEQITQKGGSVKVKFKDLTGKLYRNSNGDYDLSANATGLEIVG